MTGSNLSATICGEELILLSEKAIYWPARKTMLIADLHIGKVQHFRRHGIAVPGMAEQNNLWRLSGILQKWKPEVLIFMGDLFHSAMNAAWPVFTDFLAGIEKTEFILVKGNHDILPAATFETGGLKVLEQLETGPFLLTHLPEKSDLYNLHGHIHPGVSLRGKGRQSLRLPCFHFAERYGILPSFGDFTGMYVIRPKAGDQVFVISDREVMKI
jgi:DNA ligase-associated metallophosphoesterase